ncbi:hypothetical protein [Fischerella thermalis]|uniref:hypothetical protein n=1 Tax=Fischerella thermalis TaxID=372787 RepID=UPI0021555156|nr:hypothetical protein [Fischerella thermalis]
MDKIEHLFQTSVEQLVREIHAYLWQYYCCQWLRSRKIYPNPGTQPSQTPTEYQLTERRRKILRWESDIRRLEEEAKRYCN